jgi:hypothetical protein
MTLNIQWTSHLSNDPKEKKALEESIIRNKDILDRLKSLLEEKEKSLYNKSISPSSYNTPSWDALRAHNDGRLFEINELKTLVTI